MNLGKTVWIRELFTSGLTQVFIIFLFVLSFAHLVFCVPHFFSLFQ